MGQPLPVAQHLTMDQLAERFRRCTTPDERDRLHCVPPKLRGMTSAAIASIFLRKEDWVRRTVRRYNAFGPDALKDGRAENGAPRVLDDEGMDALMACLALPPEDGGLWSGPKVAAWIRTRTGGTCTDRTGWAYLVRAGYSLQQPRPSHPAADKTAQEAFKKGGLQNGFRASLRPIPAAPSRSGRWMRPGSD